MSDLPIEERVEAVQQYLENAEKMKGRATAFRRSIGGRTADAMTAGLGDRSKKPKRTWRTVQHMEDKADNTAAVPSSYQTKVNNEIDFLNSYWGLVGIMEPEYDLLESYTLLDVESYYKQSIDRRLSLAFRNGVEVTGDNQSFVNYIEKRFDQMGFMMRKPFIAFLHDVLLNLYICSNCVVLKIRDKEASGGTSNEKNLNKAPVAGYEIMPPQTIYPYFNGRGQVIYWRRFFGDGRPYRDYAVDDIIHFFWDRKPGHMFGTPRSVTVRDDIFALRRLEENVELLLVSHLFPLFHVAIGSDDIPAQIMPNGMSEIDIIRRLIEEMPKEGVFVTDHRVKVDVQGANKQGVDPNPLLEHYKGRVISGLGMSPLDLGIADTANRSTADNVSQNLKDSIIADLQWFAGQVKMFIFRDLFAESNTGLSVQNAVADVTLEFHEIDVDTKIKKENHSLNAFNNNAITQDEMRSSMKKKPLTNEQQKQTHHELHVMSVKKFDAKTQEKLQDKQLENAKELAKHAAKEQGATARHTAISTKKTKVTRKFANGGSHSKEVTEPIKGAVAIKDRPTNQHGSNLDPHNARSSEDPSLVELIYDGLAEAAQVRTDIPWGDLSVQTLAELLPGDELNEIRAELLPYLGDTFDPDKLYVQLEAWAQEITE